MKQNNTKMTPFQSLLHDWQGYFQMTAECSATLIGLMFVVVTQGARLFGRKGMRVVRTFLSPILGYYIQSLMIAALLCVPNQTQFSLIICMLLVALVRGGLLLQNHLEFRSLNRLKKLTIDKWLHHFLIPGTTVPAYFICAAALYGTPEISLDLIGGVVLFGIILGINECWRLVIQMEEMDPEEVSQIHELYLGANSTVVIDSKTVGGGPPTVQG